MHLEENVELYLDGVVFGMIGVDDCSWVLCPFLLDGMKNEIQDSLTGSTTIYLEWA